MDRRKFMLSGAAFIAAMSIPKFLRAQNCAVPISPDRYGYGPFYLENAPLRVKLAQTNELGEKLAISGVVSDCNGPVKGVTLEVWHATQTGCYIHPGQPTCQDQGNPEITRLWGTLITDDNGYYAFETIKPGVYLNGNAYRPSHIHFRIRSNKNSPNPVDLVTQLYFQGDKYIAGDYGADEPNAKSRTIPLLQSDIYLTGAFNITLPGNQTGIGRKQHPLYDPALKAFDVFVQKIDRNYLIHLPTILDNQNITMKIFAMDGSLINQSLVRELPIKINVSLLNHGYYKVQLQWQTLNSLRTEMVTLKN